MSMKRIIAATVCLALLAAGCALAESEDGKRWLRLGTSSLMIQVDDSYVQGEITEEDIADDQVAYLYSDERTLDFDVYQFSKEGLPDTLAEYMAQEISEYASVSEQRADDEFNGIPAAWYRTIEPFEGVEYETITYIMEDGDEFVEIVFWLSVDNDANEAGEIIQSLTRVD